MRAITSCMSTGFFGSFGITPSNSSAGRRGGCASAPPVGQLCVGDVSRLTQLQHGTTPCEQYVVRSLPNSVTVSYSCKGQGQGLTTIRKESGKLIQIQSQGIRNNAPFSFSVEGRKTVAC